MSNDKNVKTAKISYIAASSAVTLMGLLLLIFPTFFSNLIGIISGVVLLIFGIVKLYGYFSKDLYSLAFQHDLAFGILLIILGAVLLFNPIKLLNFMYIVFGLLGLIDGLLKIQTSIDAKRFGLSAWWVSFVLGCIATVAGIVLIICYAKSSSVPIALLGIILTIEGILNMCTVITNVKGAKPSKKVETYFKDTDEEDKD